MALGLAGCAFGPSKEEVTQQAETNARAQIAMRMWKERCETKAGYKIYRRADNVDDIFLMKIRDGDINFDDQYKLDDPYGRDSRGDNYILNFLKGAYHQRTDQSYPAGSPPRAGFKFVEAFDPKDGVRYRYTASKKAVRQMNLNHPNVQRLLKENPSMDINVYEFVLDKVPAKGTRPRYGVTYDDISTREERDYWIAGSSLRVIDLETNEVMAERTGYMVDWAQGSRAGFRSPWLFAADHACPGFQWNPNFPVRNASGAQISQTLIFVEQVLTPSK
ncbi:MAG: hypothetical protein ACK4F8_07655 [Aquabacterium sp.]